MYRVCILCTLLETTYILVSHMQQKQSCLLYCHPLSRGQTHWAYETVQTILQSLPNLILTWCQPSTCVGCVNSLTSQWETILIYQSGHCCTKVCYPVLQTVRTVIPPENSAWSETKRGQISHKHWNWKFEPSLNQHLPVGSRHEIY